MKIIDTNIEDVKIIQPKVFDDERGYFFETFREDEFKELLGYEIDFCQESESKSARGVLRGLHYQLAPYAQAKLVRVISGKILDVVVDIRRGSKTFGMHVAIELDSQYKRQLLIPRGFAHGFVVISKEAIILYKLDNYYDKSSEKGIAYDDKDLDIDWVLSKKDLIISKKDTVHPCFYDAEVFDIKDSL